jgi:hypothetical protein
VAISLACRARDDGFLTYFNGEFGVSLRYPPAWTSNEDRKDAIWYRYFVSPAQAPDHTPQAAVTLLVGPLSGTLDEYAQGYLAGNAAGVARDIERAGAKGREYEYASADGQTRYRLLLVSDPPRVYGLYAQGAATSWDAQRKTLASVAESFALERPKLYPVTRDEAFGFALGVPASWRHTRRFASRDTLLLQYTSPALGMDRGSQSVHASLTLAVEPAPDAGELEAYYDATLKKLGEAFKVVAHDPWRGGGGWVDVMVVESAVSESRIKRFFTVRGGRGYSLIFESREDVFSRVHRWADFIAATFSAPPGAPPPPAPTLSFSVTR